MVKLRRANHHSKVTLPLNVCSRSFAPTSEPHLRIPDFRTLLVLLEIGIPRSFMSSLLIQIPALFLQCIVTQQTSGRRNANELLVQTN